MKRRTVDEVLQTIHPENGEVFIISKGRRLPLAKCNLKIDIVQHSTFYSALNPKGYAVKKNYVSIVLCIDPEMADNITDDVFERAEKYEIYCEIETAVGFYRKIKLENLFEESVDLSENEWEFRIEDQATVKKLMEAAAQKV